MVSSLLSTPKTSPSPEKIILNPYKSLPKQLLPILKEYRHCDRCDLSSYRCNIVLYRGVCPCDCLFIGEAPGGDEDLSGEPFVGKAGRLLQTLIDESQKTIGTYRYGITNIVACYPLSINPKTGNRGFRVPNKEEALACRDRLQATVEAANPALIITLGETAKKYLKLPESLREVPVEHLRHPSFIIRNGGKGSLEYQRNLLYLEEYLDKHLGI